MLDHCLGLCGGAQGKNSLGKEEDGGGETWGGGKVGVTIFRKSRRLLQHQLLPCDVTCILRDQEVVSLYGY